MGVGTVRFMIDSGRVIKVTEVLYVPDLDRRLLSIPSLVAKGASVEFTGDGCIISFEGRLVARVEKRDKLFVWNVVETTDEERMPDVAASAELPPGSLWHERLGHVSKKMVLASRAAEGVPSFVQDEEGSVDALCAGCSCGKMTVSPFSRQSGSVVKTAGLLDIVHSDVMGPMKPQSQGGARFVVTFVDDYSRYVHAYLIKAKSEVFARFKEYKALVEAQTGRRIRCVRSDNGGEYVNKQFGDYFAAHGIVHQTSTPYTPQQNGLAERMNRTLVEMARSMLYHRGMAREWWGEALHTAVYVTNRVPNTARPQSTPHEVFMGHKPDLSHLRVFGSRGFVHVDKSRRIKWDARAHACIFLGYAAGSKAYSVWDVEDERVVTTRTVVLDERPVDNNRNVVHVTRQAPLELDDDVNLVQQQPIVPVTDNGGDTEMAEVDDDPVDMEVDMVPNTLVQSQHDGQEMSRRGGEERTMPVSASIPDTIAARQLTNQASLLQSALVPSSARTGGTSLSDHLVFGPTRPRQVRISAQQQPRLLTGTQEPSTAAYPALPPSEGSRTTGGADRFLLEDGENNSSSGQDATGNGYTSDGRLDEPDAKRPRIDDEYEIALAASESIPNSFGDAMRSPESDKWKEACRAEIRAHVRNHTWDLVYRPPGVRVIGHKWVFALKRDEHGNIIRYKARLVALGCFQTYGVDYTSTYSPVASLNTVRIFLAVCCQRGYVVKQYDVETAFLNGDLEEEVYMVPPEGINVRDGMVCRLRRSLYGLKQAAAVWHKTIRSVFIALGFKQCKSCPCLFVRVGQNGPVYIVLYVDDLLIGCEAEEEASSIAEALGARFRLKSLGDARFILGMELHYNTQKGEVFVGQAQYISRMIARFGQADAHPVRNPNVIGQDLRASNEHPKLDAKKPYRELVGSLLYVANATRPDICVAVGILSQHLEDPREMHWRAAVRVLRYLKGTLSTGIKYCRGTQLRLLAFSDANWGSDLSTRRSTSGVLLQLCGGPVVFKAKKQATVALSSAEAEYMAIAVAVQEVLWVRQLLKEMAIGIGCATDVFIDNKAAISMASNSGYTPLAKHIDLRVHFVRDHVENGAIKVQHVRSAQQLADYLTKPLPTPQFVLLVTASGVVRYNDHGAQVEGEC
ncbi:hypothetical protein PR001_g27622 [Phytophthora rubi]|uniref:Integrase catalytic domain-containing protein n=1 Tax=Phytophthora rubi TaxID=129364 RepID=A0A6A3HK30_9STRA|nr:hypothetical protein PR001_g27622 [Phytophthora rubi]